MHAGEVSGFFIVRKRGRLYAVASACTHKEVKLVVIGGVLKCPRHGSLFDDDGIVTKGPVREALPRFAICLDGDRQVKVDTKVGFSRKQWKDSPRSYLTL